MDPRLQLGLAYDRMEAWRRDADDARLSRSLRDASRSAGQARSLAVVAADGARALRRAVGLGRRPSTSPR